MTNGGSANEEDVENVQKMVADLEIYNSILPILPATIFCLFVGAWSDTHGRKLILIISFLMRSAMLLIYTINYALFYDLNVYHLLWVGAFGLCSAGDVMIIAVFGYLGNLYANV